MRSIRVLAVAGAAITAAALTTALTTVPAAASGAQWAAVKSIANHQAAGWATAVSPDGGTVFVTGSVTNDSDDVGFGETIAYDAATGASLWDAKLVLTKSYYETGLRSIAVSPDGSTVFVTGYSGNGIAANGFYQVVVAYNAATGAELWEKTGGLVGAAASPVTVSPDSSTVYVTNGSVGTAAYDATTGAQLWTNPAGGDGSVLSTDGSTLYTTGSGASGVTQAISTSTGASLWQVTVGSYTGYGSPSLSPDGSTLYVTGGVGTGKPGSDSETFVTVAYAAATGTQVWTQTTASGNYGGGAMGVAETSTGSAVIASDWTENETGKGALYTGWVTDALDPATGAVLWTQTTRAKYPDTDFGSALALSPDGSTAYVLGYTNNDKTTVYRVTGYGTGTGSPVWGATYDGRPSNFAYAMALSPDGSQLFATGASTRPAPNLQDVIATVAFGTSTS
jgi:hypothetical protein